MPNTKRCFCEDWVNSADQLNACVGFCSIQSAGPKLNEYYAIWKFCPWCGSPLAESREEWEKQNTGIKALVDFVRNQEDAPPEFNKVYEDNQIASLITATHLAALEAIKKEDEG